MKVICISGKAQHGKDTTGKMLKDILESNGKKVLITHYGDLIKYVCKTFFGWNGEKDEAGRSLLQRVGTDVVRAQDPDFWCSFLVKILVFFNGDWDYVLIPDVRLPSEVTALKDAGLDVCTIRVVRPNYDNGLTEEQKNHITETAMDSFETDYVVQNDSSIWQLMKRVRVLAESL